MASSIQYSKSQQAIIDLPLSGSLFLDGRAGCGKTTAAAGRLQRILNQDISGSEVIVLIPARGASRQYSDIYSDSGARAQVVTYGSFIKRSIELFWPLITQSSPFKSAEQAPTFLTIETAQILMAGLIKTRLEDGYFNALQQSTSRIYNQILIALHKMAAGEFPFNTYAQRMRASWTGDSAMLMVFDQVQECGTLFRETCFSHNLLDYSIQVEIFQNNLLPNPRFTDWLKRNFRHFFYDNLEEDTPAAHHFAAVLRDCCESSCFIADHLGGFRNFMGSDTRSAFQLAETCSVRRTMNESFVCSPEINAMALAVENPQIPVNQLPANPENAFFFQAFHQYPTMIRQAALDAANLIHHQNVPPDQIVIIAPLISDVLYTSLERELRVQNIPCRVHRPSKPLIEGTYTKCFLILLALLHPEWGVVPRMLDFCEMLMRFVPGLDPIRSQALVGRAFKSAADTGQLNRRFILSPREEIQKSLGRRINQHLLIAYEQFRLWIERNTAITEAPDITLARFFHEFLARQTFGDASGEISRLSQGAQIVIESLRKCRLVMETSQDGLIRWDTYLQLCWEGMVSARYEEESASLAEDQVLITLSSAFAIANQPAAYQIWLNAGSPRWWERIYGALSNDYILSQDWQPGELWSIQKNAEVNNENMVRLVLALLSRCGTRVLAYASELNESGQDQKSNLLYVFSNLAYRFGQDSSVWQAEEAAQTGTSSAELDAALPLDEPDIDQEPTE